MLNYIWAGLIIFSLVFALVSDIRDETNDAYRNEQPLPLTLAFPEGVQPEARRVPVEVRIDPAAYGRFYGVEARPESLYAATLVRNERGSLLRFDADAALPEPLETIRGFSSSNDDELQGRLGVLPVTAAGPTAVVETAVRFEPVHFVKLRAITQAAFDFAETAVTLALGLIGALALWLGLLKIAETSGLLYSVVKVTQPLFRPLFPDIPKDHPAFGMITLNLTANVLGLGNAATPLGIKAMEELQKLNPTEDTATDSMVMLLAMNTASVQLVPPVLLVAIMGLQINELIFGIWIVTGISLAVAITSAKLLGRLPGYRRTKPIERRADVPPEAPPTLPPPTDDPARDA